MDPYAFTNTDNGILNAEHALKSLRAILDVNDDNDNSVHDVELSSSTTATTQESADPDELLELNEDKIIALHEQLKGLEDMLRLVTDARLARSLSGQDIEVDEEIMDVLRRVIRIANDIIGSETTYGDEGTSALLGETSLSHWSRYVQSDASVYSLEGPLSPLTELSESDSELEPDPICIVCATDLSPPNRVQMPCGHIYCPDCTKELVKTYTTRPFSNGLLRCCPHPKPSISLHHVGPFITVSLLKNLDEKLKEAETPHDQRIYCPQENCKKFINPDRVTPIVKRVGYINCPNDACRVRICLDCKDLIHIGVDCGTHADDSQAKRIQTQYGWGRCPGCRFVIEKISGCDHVLCTRCGRDFTYSAGILA